MKRRTFLAVAVTLLAFVTACSGSDDDTNDEASNAADATISVYAVERLQIRLEELTAAYAGENPKTKIDFTFGMGPKLASEIREGGAEPDVYIDFGSRVGNVVARHDSGEPLALGSDVMQIVVPLGNPKAISGLDVFGDDPAILSGLCADDVGCGQSARTVLEAAGIAPAADRTEPTAGALLNAVADGELDAGLLFRTQISSAPNRTQGIDLPSENNAEVLFAIGVLSDNDAAAAFATWLVESTTADEILVRRGLRVRS